MAATIIGVLAGRPRNLRPLNLYRPRGIDCRGEQSVSRRCWEGIRTFESIFRQKGGRNFVFLVRSRRIWILSVLQCVEPGLNNNREI